MSSAIPLDNTPVTTQKCKVTFELKNRNTNVKYIEYIHKNQQNTD